MENVHTDIRVITKSKRVSDSRFCSKSLSSDSGWSSSSSQWAAMDQPTSASPYWRKVLSGGRNSDSLFPQTNKGVPLWQPTNSTSPFPSLNPAQGILPINTNSPKLPARGKVNRDCIGFAFPTLRLLLKTHATFSTSQMPTLNQS